MISAVYAHLKQPVKSLCVDSSRFMFYFRLTRVFLFPRWSPGKFPYNVTHNSDVSAALWRCATWIEEIGGREKAELLAGEVIYPHNAKKYVGEVEGMVSLQVPVKAPLFHLVRW